MKLRERTVLRKKALFNPFVKCTTHLISKGPGGALNAHLMMWPANEEISKQDELCGDRSTANQEPTNAL